MTAHFIDCLIVCVGVVGFISYVCVSACLRGFVSLSLPLSRSAVMIFIAIFAAGGLGGRGGVKYKALCGFVSTTSYIFGVFRRRGALSVCE